MRWIKTFLRENWEAVLDQASAAERGTLPGLGWLLPAGMLAAKAIKAIGKGKKEKKQGEAFNVAEKAKATAAQTNRRSRLGMLQTMLQGLQKGLGTGASYGGSPAPNYTLDPAAMASMQEAPAYVPAPDATAGAGWGMVGDLSDVAGGALETYALGKLLGKPSTPGMQPNVLPTNPMAKRLQLNKLMGG